MICNFYIFFMWQYIEMTSFLEILENLTEVILIALLKRRSAFFLHCFLNLVALP